MFEMFRIVKIGDKKSFRFSLLETDMHVVPPLKVADLFKWLRISMNFQRWETFLTINLITSVIIIDYNDFKYEFKYKNCF